MAVYLEQNPLSYIKNQKKCVRAYVVWGQLHTKDLPLLSLFTFSTSSLVLQVSRIGSALQFQSTGHAQAEETYVQRTVSLQALTVIFV